MKKTRISLPVFLFFLAIQFTTFQSIYANNIDSLSSYLQQQTIEKSSEYWLEKCLQIADEQLEIDEIQSAIHFYTAAQEKAQKYNDTYSLQLANIGIAECLYREGSVEESLQKFKSLLNTIDTSSLELRGKVQRAISTNYMVLGDYSGAYDAQTKARSIYSKLKDTTQVARLEYGIGNNFFYQKQYELSLQHFQNALKLLIAVKNEGGIQRTYSAIGSVYENLGNYPKALEYVSLALEMAKQSNDKAGIAWTLLNMGSIQNNMGDNENALKSLSQANKMSVELWDELLEMSTLRSLGSLYFKTKTPSKAIQAYNKSLEISLKNNYRGDLVELYKEFAEVYFEVKDYPNYQKYINKHLSLKDSIFSEQLIEDLSSLKKGFEKERMEKEKEIQLLKKDKELDEFQNNSRFRITLLICVIGLLGIGLLLVRHRGAQEKNLILAQKNEEILQQNKSLDKSNRDLEQYAYIISHDLKEPLRNISGFTRLLERKLSGTLDEASMEYMAFIKKGANQMHHLLNDILEYSKIKNDSKNRELVSVKLLLEEITTSFQHQITSSDIVVHIGDMPLIYFNKSQLYQIFQNLIGNAIKFRNTEISTKIDIKYYQKNQKHHFSVTDNGIGISEEFRQKIFVAFQRLHNRADFEGSGIGLATCKKIIEENGGSIDVNSVEGQGSTFYFILPSNLIELDKNATIQQPFTKVIDTQII